MTQKATDPERGEGNIHDNNVVPERTPDLLMFCLHCREMNKLLVSPLLGLGHCPMLAAQNN